MKRPLDLEALRSFDAVALHDGLGAAARATRRPKATLSRHLAELEQDLGVRLVERGERRLRLTDDGRRLHERTHDLLIDLRDAAETAVSGAETPRGALRVSAPMVLAHVALMPIITRFCVDHPEVQLELAAEDRRVDPVEDGYDVVLRIDPRPDERLVGRRVAHDRRLVVAAPSRPAPSDPDGRAVPAILSPTVGPFTTWRVRRPDGGVFVLEPERRLALSSLLMARDAAIAGVGAALLPRLLVQPDVAAGRLSCWGELDQPPVEIWALHPSRRLVSAKVRAFLTALESLGRYETVSCAWENTPRPIEKPSP